MTSVIVISALADKLADRWHARDDIGVVLAKRYRKMLHDILSAPGLTAPLDREVSVRADLRFVVGSLHEAFRADAMEHYFGAPVDRAGEPSFHLPARRHLSKSPDQRKAEGAAGKRSKRGRSR